MVDIEGTQATVSIIDSTWSGTETAVFVVTDEGTQNGFSDSTTADFTVLPDHSPVVAPIADQTIELGEAFTSFDLDDLLTELDGDAVVWSSGGAVQLDVAIDGGNVATVTDASGTFTGQETMTFTATDVTDDQGRVTFREIVEPDRISATRQLHAPSRGWSLSEDGQYKVQLLSEAGFIEREAHFVQATVSEHFVVVSQGSSVLAQATVYSFDRPSTVVLEIGESDTPPAGITMTTRPAIATLPTTGRARLQLTIAVGSNVQPGTYELALVPDVRDEERELGEAEGYGIGAGTLSVKVKPVQ